MYYFGGIPHHFISTVGPTFVTEDPDNTEVLFVHTAAAALIFSCSNKTRTLSPCKEL